MLGCQARDPYFLFYRISLFSHVQEQLGHISVKTTRIYARVTMDCMLKFPGGTKIKNKS